MLAKICIAAIGMALLSGCGSGGDPGGTSGTTPIGGGNPPAAATGISGKAVGSNGMPVSGAMVTLNFAPATLIEGKSVPESTVTNANGEYSLAAVPPGFYMITVTQSAGLAVPITVLTSFQVSNSAAITLNFNMDPGSVLSAAHGSVVGIITDSRTGLPVAGATVSIAAEGVPASGSGITAATDGSGRFSINNVPPALYQLTITGRQIASPSLSQVEVQAGATSEANETVN